MDIQTIRLLDVFVIAPILIYASGEERLSKTMRVAILGIGLATLFYNGHNYLKARENA